jgi:hypothetical protein
MDLSYMIFAFVILALLLASFLVDRKGSVRALKVGYVHLQKTASLFLALFLLMGLFQVFVSPSVIQRLMGSGTGILAPLTGLALGGVAAGPPIAIYPIAQFLASHEASAAAVATLITAWASVGTVELPAEIKMLGRRFALSHWVVALTFSLLIGIGTGLVVRFA